MNQTFSSSYTQPRDQTSDAAPPVSAEGEEPTQIGASRGLVTWLIQNRTSFAFSSYQSGRLMLVGAAPNGTVSVHQQYYARAMGLWSNPNQLYLASRVQLWRLENVLQPGAVNENGFDALFVPRNSHYTGEIDAHEVAVDRDGRVIIVNTLHSCLVTLDRTHSFRPIWKPSFISELAAEDRCHLNGVGLLDGQPKYATAVGQSDVADGWHGRPLPKGVVIDIETDRIVTDELSMPHSPRAVDGQIYALDSGRGYLVRIDPQSGKVEDVCFCPGFLRGMAIHGRYALVTISKPRHGGFEGLPIDEELKKRQGTPMCGVLIVDLDTGEIAEWLKLEGHVKELFAVVTMPGVRCPASIGVTTDEFVGAISFDPEIRPLGSETQREIVGV